MADPGPVPVTATVIVTVAITNPDSVNRTATFTYTGPGVTEVNEQWFINAQKGAVTLYEFTPAPGLTPAPFTAVPTAVDWIWLNNQNWTVTVDGTNVNAGSGGPAGFRVSVVLGGVTYVGDPTIIMVDPPPPPPYR